MTCQRNSKKLKKNYDDLVNEAKQRDENNERDDIEVLARYKQRGFRRSPNSDHAVPNTEKSASQSKLFSCNNCVYKTESEERLKVECRLCLTISRFYQQVCRENVK